MASGAHSESGSLTSGLITASPVCGFRAASVCGLLDPFMSTETACLDGHVRTNFRPVVVTGSEGPIPQPRTARRGNAVSRFSKGVWRTVS